jgi:hypothetical protein
MEKLIQILLGISVLFSCTIALSQEYIIPSQRHFKFEAEYYELNYRGLKDFMQMRQISDTDIYASMLPEYNRIKSRFHTAMIGGISGFVVGSGIALSPLYSLDDPNAGSKFATRLIVGSVIMGVGIGFYLRLPGQRDYLHFINQHNQNFRERQIELVLSTNAHGTPGLGLALRF